MNSTPIDMSKVQTIVDTLVKGEAIDSVIETLDHGFGSVEIKLTIVSGQIKIVAVSTTKTTKIE